MFAKVLASLVLLACVVLAVHMALPLTPRRWLEARSRRALTLMRSAWFALKNLRRNRAIKKAATAEAEAAIKRARAGSKMVEGEWDGNVYRPKSFDSKKQQDRRNLH